MAIPLAVRLTRARTDGSVLADSYVTLRLHSLRFRKAVPGGFASATFDLSQSLKTAPAHLDPFTIASVIDTRSARLVWQGRLEDPGRATPWQLAAIGTSAHARDRHVMRTYLNLTASQIVQAEINNYLPRYTAPSPGSIDATSFVIAELRYSTDSSDATPAKVFEDVLALEPDYWWAAWEAARPGLPSRFEFRRWPTTVRYEATAEDGFESPSSAAELYNEVMVHYKDPAGVQNGVLRTRSVPLLDGAGLVRSKLITLNAEVTTTADAERAGDLFLERHAVPANVGTLRVKRRIYDAKWRRMVDPWEIEPGALIKVRDVVPRSAGLNPTARDAVSTFRLPAVDYDSADNTATLELDDVRAPLAVAA